MFLANKAEDTLVLIIDVQSSVVYGSVAVIRPGVQPRIVFTHSSNIAYEPGMAVGILIKSTVRSVEEIIESSRLYVHARNKTEKFPPIPRKISNIHFVLSSPWIVSETKVLSLAFEKDTEISRKYIGELIRDDRAKIVSKTKEPLEVIEQKIFDVRLNGYSVSDWEKKEARSLDVSFTVSVAGTKMIEYFIEASKHIVHTSKIQFHSSLLLQYISIERVLEPDYNYIMAYVHGDQTDIFVVRNKTCVFFGSFSFGARTILSKIEIETKNNRHAVDSLMALYINNRLEGSHNKKVGEVIQKVFGEWSQELKRTLDESKVEIDNSMPIILNAMAFENCFTKTLKLGNVDEAVSLLSIDDFISDVVFEDLAERNRLAALYTIAIHSLFV